ncbi:hypothetical protein PV326_012701 [Microctonus aethiopoides]|nr:hypothetical protein PV326_012701 [Microctonus aethiopoides]
MSNIYIQEPPTSGKVLLKTSVGDIDLELWTREAPKACKNFIQLCMEGYYDGTIFHRVVKGFIVQGGDPTGTGEHGESIYGHPFKDEFHTRLRFCRRGLLAMANAGKNDNGSQFFITLGATPELQNKHTIFGKVTGETIYNMLKLEDAEVDQNERPLYPQKIIKSEILLNPFLDIVPRSQPKVVEKLEKTKAPKTAAVKNFKLLSFGEEAEEDEKEFEEHNIQYSGVSKSAHDKLSDPKLSAATGMEVEERKRDENDAEDRESDVDNETKEERAQAQQKSEDMKKRIIDKLKDSKISSTRTDKKKNISLDKENSSDEEYYLGKDRDDERKKQVEAIRKEIKDLKRGVKNERKQKETKEKEKLQEEEKKLQKSQLVNEYITTQKKYKEVSAKIPKKGTSREQFTLQLLTTFRNKLKSVKEQTGESTGSSSVGEMKNSDNDSEETWMTHTLQCEDNLVLAKDASKKDDDWFEIYDPRNPINKRRRGEQAGSKSESTNHRSHRRRR